MSNRTKTLQSRILIILVVVSGMVAIATRGAFNKEGRVIVADVDGQIVYASDLEKAQPKHFLSNGNVCIIYRSKSLTNISTLCFSLEKPRRAASRLRHYWIRKYIPRSCLSLMMRLKSFTAPISPVLAWT